MTSHALDPPPPCHKLSHLLGPPPFERDVLYGRPLCVCRCVCVHACACVCAAHLCSIHHLWSNSAKIKMKVNGTSALLLRMIAAGPFKTEVPPRDMKALS